MIIENLFFTVLFWIKKFLASLGMTLHFLFKEKSSRFAVVFVLSTIHNREPPALLLLGYS
jgi:hypothetical protein